jgi:hypothetical protein
MHTFSLVSIALPLLAAALPQPGPGLAVRQSYLVDTEYPHLLVPLKQDQPDVAFGTQYTGAVKQVCDSYGNCANGVCSRFEFLAIPHCI